MLSAVFSSSIQPGGKNLLRAFATLLTGVSGYGVFYNFENYLKSSQEWKNIESGLQEFKPIRLEGRDARVF
jgi:hypothetical protein